MSVSRDDASRDARSLGIALTAMDAARFLSNPDKRRGYRLTAAMAGVVAAAIGEKVTYALTDVETSESTTKALREIEALCRAMVGAE